MFMAWIVADSFTLYTYLQTHEVLYIKYVKLSVGQAYLNEVIFKRKKLQENIFYSFEVKKVCVSQTTKLVIIAEIMDSHL